MVTLNHEVVERSFVDTYYSSLTFDMGVAGQIIDDRIKLR